MIEQRLLLLFTRAELCLFHLLLERRSAIINAQRSATHGNVMSYSSTKVMAQSTKQLIAKVVQYRSRRDHREECTCKCRTK